MLKKNLSSDSPFSTLTNETKKIKEWYGMPFVKVLVDELSISDKKSFLRSFKKNYTELELKDRLRLIAMLLDSNLEGSYRNKLNTLSKLLGPEWPHEKGMLNYGFYLYPVSQFVENHALRDIHASLSFIEELTKRFTGEFAVRPVFAHDQKLALAIAKKWSKDENFHLRRLASEGLRARLPWGSSISWIKVHPQKTIPLLTTLRNDPVLYVRRSVANALGDIIKIDEDLALKTCETWLSKKQTKENLWVISHGIRHAVKKGKIDFISLKKELLTKQRHVPK
jgi:3-methyladenine DNA glycosylase AlkC